MCSLKMWLFLVLQVNISPFLKFPNLPKRQWVNNLYIIQYMSEWSLSHTYFLPKSHHSFLVRRDTRQVSALYVGTNFNSEITNRKNKTVKHVALQRLWKLHIMVSEVKQKGKVLPYWTSDCSLLSVCLRITIDFSPVLYFGLKINVCTYVSSQIWNL